MCNEILKFACKQFRNINQPNSCAPINRIIKFLISLADIHTYVFMYVCIMCNYLRERMLVGIYMHVFLAHIGISLSSGEIATCALLPNLSFIDVELLQY